MTLLCKKRKHREKPGKKYTKDVRMSARTSLWNDSLLLFVFLYFPKFGVPYFLTGKTKAMQRMTTELYLLIQCSNKLTEQGRQEV